MLPSPRLATSRFILPWRSPPQSSFAHYSRSASFDPSSNLPGVSALFAAPPGSVHSREGCHALTIVPSSGFLSLSTVCSALRLCRLVSSHKPRPGLSPSRGFSPHAAALLHQKRMPPCRSASTSPGALARRLPKDSPSFSPKGKKHETWSPPLRGFDPREAAFIAAWG